jgi:UrcA family protein
MTIARQIPDRAAAGLYGKLALMAACAAVMTAGVARQLAAHPAETSVAVSFAGLDLTTDQGKQAAFDRIYKTAQHLCEGMVNPWSLSHHEDFLHCVDDATGNAVVQLQALVFAAGARSRAPGSASNNATS